MSCQFQMQICIRGWLVSLHVLLRWGCYNHSEDVGKKTNT